MKIRIHIDFENALETQITAGVFPEVVNVSNTADIFTKPTIGYKGFQLSPSKSQQTSALDGTCNFYGAEGYRGLLTRAISAENGLFDTPPIITFKISGRPDNTLYIMFDQLSNEYATRFTLNVGGTVYTIDNDSPFCPVELYNVDDYLTDEIDVTLKIVRWSKPYASAKIAYISYNYTEVFTSSTIEQLTFSENAFGGQTLVQPGIVEQYADISLYDRYGRLHRAAKRNKLLENASVKIEALNSDDVITQIGSYRVSSWDISNDNTSVQLTAADPAVNFDKIKIANIQVQDRNLHEMLTLLFSYVKGYTWKYDTKDTQKYCTAVVTPNSWFKADTLDNILQKVCTAGMLRIYWYNDTFIVTRCW